MLVVMGIVRLNYDMFETKHFAAWILARFRGDELTRLQIEDVSVFPGEGMTCYLSQTKSDRRYQRTSFKTPALSKLCPVDAFVDWIHVAGLSSEWGVSLD